MGIEALLASRGQAGKVAITVAIVRQPVLYRVVFHDTF